MRRLILAVAMCAALGVGASDAVAAFGPTHFEATVSTNQAGARPDAVTSFDLETDSEGIPVAATKDITVEAPPGLVGNPQAFPTCTTGALQSSTGCPKGSIVGTVDARLTAFGGLLPLFNVEPPKGVLASFAAIVNNLTVVRLDAEIRTDGDYGLTVRSRDTGAAVGLIGSTVTLWGVPADHLGTGPQEFWPFDSSSKKAFEFTGFVGVPFGGPARSLPRRPFITNSSECGVPRTTTLGLTSWPEPNRLVSMMSAPTVIEGCGDQPFQPSIAVDPSSTAADSPTGLNVSLGFGQNEDPNGLGVPPLRSAHVRLPAGLSINPSSASGLVACGDDRLHLRSKLPVECPVASRIGTVTAKSPALKEKLAGGVFVRPQASDDPASGDLFRIALVLENAERGVSVRLPGGVKVDPDTGQIEARFEENPQLPVSDVTVSLAPGSRASLATPQQCGGKTTKAELGAWSGQAVTLTDRFEIACAGSQPFHPSMSAGTMNPLSGATSSFVLRLGREDGQQSLSALTFKLPEGLTAYLKGVPYCPDAALAAAAGRRGAEEAATPSCPAASRIGTVETAAGAGDPLHVPGKAYLAGPYKGAPLSLAVVTPAVAGPFDLGTVVVRAALRVDPTTAEITAVSDPLPQIVKGVPLRLREVEVDVDRPDFTLNPTSCDPMQVKGTIGSANGQSADVSSRFQVAGCERLAFKPRLALRLSGAPTRRGGYPKLRAVLRMPKQGANIRRARVLLPKTEFLENAHIRTICTRVQYAAGKGGGEACPKASVYGYAKAWSPLLDKPLQGPVYLRSSNHKLPDLVASLDGQIHVDLVGRIDAVRARIRNTFETVPDAPVSRFVLTMQGGRKGLLVNNTQLCKAKPRASVRFVGQNGKAANSKPLVKVARCGKKRK